jgi:hypothetical protein
MRAFHFATLDFEGEELFPQGRLAEITESQLYLQRPRECIAPRSQV